MASSNGNSKEGSLLTGREVRIDTRSYVDGYTILESEMVPGLGAIIERDGPFLIVEGETNIWIYTIEALYVTFAETKFKEQNEQA